MILDSLISQVHSRIPALLVLALLSVLTSVSSAWSPGSNWRDSYAVGGQCYCDSSNFDHDLDTKNARTPLGVKNVVTICEDIESAIGEGADSGRIPYNDIQCGNGPVNNAADETGCPGRVDQGSRGCMTIGPRWNLEAVYGPWPESCSASKRLMRNTWYMFSLPCDVQLAGKASVAEVLADDLGMNALGQRWAIYALLDDGSYVALSLDDELRSGIGYWLLTTENDKTIEVSGEYPIEVDVNLRSDTVTGAWTLVGTPFSYPVSWADVNVVDTESGRVELLFADDPGVDACSEVPISSNCTVSPLAYKWTESGSYEVLDRSSGTLNVFDGAWVRAGANGTRLRLPVPALEFYSHL